jgi:integrase
MIHLKKTKNSHPRSLALVGKARQALQELYNQKQTHQEKVFPSKKRFGQIDIRKAWTRACKEAGLDNLRQHDLRHCFTCG